MCLKRLETQLPLRKHALGYMQATYHANGVTSMSACNEIEHLHAVHRHATSLDALTNPLPRVSDVTFAPFDTVNDTGD